MPMAPMPRCWDIIAWTCWGERSTIWYWGCWACKQEQNDMSGLNIGATACPPSGACRILQWFATTEKDLLAWCKRNSRSDQEDKAHRGATHVTMQRTCILLWNVALGSRIRFYRRRFATSWCKAEEAPPLHLLFVLTKVCLVV